MARIMVLRTRWRVAPWFACVGLVPLGCVSRVIRDGNCDVEEAAPGEVCFGEHETIDVPFDPLALRVAPFDGDGLSDILVTGVDDAGTVVGSLSRSQLDGALGPLQPAAVSGCSAYPAVGDVGDSGPADLLFDQCDDTMLVFVVHADATIEAPRVVDLDVTTLGSALLDGDGDGVGDVIAIGEAGETVWISLARGSAGGGYLPPLLTAVGSKGATDAPYSLSIGLIDDDHRYDLVLSHGDPTRPPTFVRGTADAGFGVPEPWPELGVAKVVSFANTDGEGEPEIVVFRAEPAAIEVWSGALGSARKVGATEIEALAHSSFAAGDFDADRNLDLALFDADERDVVIWLGDGRGDWQEEAKVRFAAPVEALSVGDLDADGAADLVAGTFSESTITVARGAP
jgi:hypothetical protein